MNKKWVIEAVVILDEGQSRLKACIADRRPDLAVHTYPVDKSLLRPNHYAIIAFNPGESINDFADVAWIHCSGAGVDYLLGSLTNRVPLITRTIGAMGDQIAEFVVAYALYFKQRIGFRKELQAARLWDKAAASPQFLKGSSALVFGSGAIGRKVADRLGSLSVHCVGVSRSGQMVPSFDSVVSLSKIGSIALDDFDLVVLALPNHSQAQSLIDRRILERMQASVLINVGRAQTLVVEDLLSALDKGYIGEAVLDVFDMEPLAEDSPLWTHPKVTVTPHIAGLSQPEDVADAFVDALQCLEAGGEPELVVSQDSGY